MIFNRKIFWFVVGVLIIIPSCWKQSEKRTGLVLINVLDKALYDDCHIIGSVHIPFEMIETLPEKRIDKSADIVVYCSNYQCTSSDYAARKLKKQGFNQVAIYEGGMAEWYQKGLPIEGPHKQQYLMKTSMPSGVSDNGEIPIITIDELKAKMGLS